MQRLSILVLSLALVLGLGYPHMVTGSEAEGQLCLEVGTLTLQPLPGVEAKRVPVPFPHGVHFDFACQTCHHTWEKSAEILSCSASGCHDLAAAPAPGDKESASRYYKNAFHGLCIGCHKEIKQTNLALVMSGSVLKDKLPAAGPTSCKECHIDE